MSTVIAAMAIDKGIGEEENGPMVARVGVVDGIGRESPGREGVRPRHRTLRGGRSCVLAPGGASNASEPDAGATARQLMPALRAVPSPALDPAPSHASFAR